MKKRRIAAVLFAAGFNAALAQQVPYGVAAQPWPESLGNHRALVRVSEPSDAIVAHVPWRRTDESPDQKAVLVFDDSNRPVLNTRALRITAESGDIVFQAPRAGEYYIYYLPHADLGSRRPALGEKGQYRALQSSADPAWLGRIGGALPSAAVVQFQARTAFDSFYPMEVAATAEEVRQLGAAHRQQFLIFPEERDHAIRMTSALPYAWIQSGPKNDFAGAAWRGEYFVFQIGVYAQKDLAPADTPISVRFEDLARSPGQLIPASALECINTGGIDTRGRPLGREFRVQAGTVGALWCGVQVPLDAAPGIYTGTMHLLPRGSAALSVHLQIEVKRDFVRAGGVDQPERLSRLKWLNSTIGLEETITAPYIPLRVSGRTVSCLGREVRFGDAGFPVSVRAGGQEVLAGPLGLSVYEGSSAVAWKTSSRVGSQTPGKVVIESVSESPGYRLTVRSTMEFDGGTGFEVKLRSLRENSASDIALEIPYRKASARFSAGMGLAGGERPSSWRWKWSEQPERWKDQGSNLEYFLWMGNAQAGLYCRLKSPLTDWKNGDKGGVRFEEQGDRVLFRASGGARALHTGEELDFSFRLLPTPVKPLDVERWNTRFAHAYRPVEEIRAAGATVVNIHHDTLPNLYINYPFLNLDLLTPYVSEAHANGLKAKVYYTVRELTTHLPELWAFRSLGDEIYRTAGTQGHGNPQLDFWLQEHLRTGYTPAWITRTPAGDVDAAIRVFFDSRLDNFYLEGLRWLLENVPIDGIYLDEIGYPREIMQRVRRVIDLRPGALIDLHGNRQWWSCNSPVGYYMEHLPYVDRLWFGEAFDPNSPPDFWLVEMSGIPFGLSSDLLQNPNPWRGMLFGMTARAFYSGAPSPSAIWKLWDQFGIREAEMIGWWESAVPVRTGRGDVLATVYRKPGRSLVAIASWSKDPANIMLDVNWRQLGIDAKRVRITAPAIPNFQEPHTFAVGAPIPVAPGKGWLLVVEQN
jgi:hypothetical protein